jgi:CRISPR type III-B/RAMP module RAMP protein Cmr6
MPEPTTRIGNRPGPSGGPPRTGKGGGGGHRGGGGGGHGNGGGENRRIYVLPESTEKLVRDAAVVHTGLQVSKFVEWKREGKGSKPDRGAAFRAACVTVAKLSNLLVAWHARRTKWLQALGERGKSLVVKAKTPCVLWLAAPTPLELGFCLHHTYGVPYLPGSGLKGLARAAMRRSILGVPQVEWANASTDEQAGLTAKRKDEPKEKPDPETPIKELFGEGGDKGWAGKVDFLDGIPLEAGCLEQEVMSPHHPDYYQGKSPIPHDCEDPIPLPFLRIKPGARFEIALVARGNLGDEDAKSALRDAEKYLLQGLSDMGLGAKTSSGYGLFEIEPTDEPASSTARGQARAEAATTGPVSGPATKKTIEGAVIDSFDSKTDRLVFKAPDGSSYEVSIRFCRQKFGINPGGLNHWRRERTPFRLEVEGGRVIGVYRH